jgi:hypothetical protein
MSASEILVIFLSVALAIFLVLSIILVIYLIVIAKKIKSVAETAERTVANFEGFSALIRKIAAPAFLSKFAMDTVSQIMKRRKK